MSTTITTPEQRTNTIHHELRALVARAEAMGVTIRVSAPQTPLRMAENNHVVEAWPARNGPKAPPEPPWMAALPDGPVREAMAPQATKIWPRTHSG